jgi:hypothetical protein
VSRQLFQFPVRDLFQSDCRVDAARDQKPMAARSEDFGGFKGDGVVWGTECEAEWHEKPDHRLVDNGTGRSGWQREIYEREDSKH